MDDDKSSEAVGDTRMEERHLLENEPASKRVKLEAAASAAAASSTNDQSSTGVSSSSPSAVSLSTSIPTSSSVHAIEEALHGVDDANSGLVHNTVAGELLEHQSVAHQYTQPMEDAESTRSTDASNNTEHQLDIALQPFPVSLPPSLSASPSPPPQPLRPPSPPPLGKYQCDNCGAVLTYASLTEIYHCPLCYHTFTLYPPLAPTTSPPLLPVDYSPLPPLIYQRLTQWTSADLYVFLHNVPGLSSIADKSLAAGMDGRYFMAMHVSDLVEEFGLWGSQGAGGSVEGNAALVVQLLNAQRLLRGDTVRSVAEEKELVAMLTGMQTVTAASKSQPAPKSAKKAKEKADKPKREPKETTAPVEDGVDNDSGAAPAATEAAPARPVKRKQYRIPTLPQPLRSPVTAATAMPASQSAADTAELDVNHTQPIAAPVTDAVMEHQPVPQQPPSLLLHGGNVEPIDTRMASVDLADGAMAAQSMLTTTDGGTASFGLPSETHV